MPRDRGAPHKLGSTTRSRTSKNPPDNHITPHRPFLSPSATYIPSSMITIASTRTIKRLFGTAKPSPQNSSKKPIGADADPIKRNRWTPPRPPNAADVTETFFEADRARDAKAKDDLRKALSWRKRVAVDMAKEHTLDTEELRKAQKSLHGKEREFSSIDGDLAALKLKIKLQNEQLRQLEQQEQELQSKTAYQNKVFEDNKKLLVEGGYGPGYDSISGKNNQVYIDPLTPLTPEQLAGVDTTSLHPHTKEYREAIQKDKKFQPSVIVDHMAAHKYAQDHYNKPVHTENTFTINNGLLKNRARYDNIHENSSNPQIHLANDPKQQYEYQKYIPKQPQQQHPPSSTSILQKLKNLFSPKSTSQSTPPHLSFSHRLKRLSPIIEQLPYHTKHTWTMFKQVTSPESFELFKAELKQSRTVLFSSQHIARTKFEVAQRLKYLSNEFDKKMREPYIEPTTEFRLQKKEILHDNIIDAHYYRDRLIDKIRSKMQIISKTFDAMNDDPRKRDILMRKILFTSLDDDSKVINRVLKLLYMPFGLFLKSLVSVAVVGLFSIEVVTSRLIPEVGIVTRQLRKYIQDYQLTPNNIVQLVCLTSLSMLVLTFGHDLAVLYSTDFLTPRGLYVSAAHAFMLTNSEEMMYDTIRELIINRLIVTPDTYREFFDPYTNIHPLTPRWGTPERYAQQQSLIQPIFTQMKGELLSLYKDEFFVPYDRLCESLRTHSVSLGFTIEALDGFLDAMYLRDTRTPANYIPNLQSSSSPHNKIVQYLLSNDYLVLPPGDIIRTASTTPNEIFNFVVQNFKTLEGKEVTMGGELFKDYLNLGARIAYRKKLLAELETLEDLRNLLQNARFPHISIPQRDIKRISCDLNDPVTKAVLHHLQDLRTADDVTPLYPNRAARQYLESSYFIDERKSHYEPDRTTVNDHYLLLCNIDNPRYTYDTLVNHNPSAANNLTFKNDQQRQLFEKHVYHLGSILNKIDATMVQSYIELRRIEGTIATALNPAEITVSGVKLHPSEQHLLELPSIQDTITDPANTAEVRVKHGLFHLSDSPSAELEPTPFNLASQVSERSSPLTDQVEYDSNHYRTLIEFRKEELRQKFNKDRTPVGAMQQIANWWNGKSSTIQYSEEYEHLIDFQATRDVMGRIESDPYLYRRYVEDFSKDKFVELKQKGYLSSQGFIDVMDGNPYNLMAGEGYKDDRVPMPDKTFNVLKNVDDNVYYKHNPSMSAFQHGDDILDYERNIKRGQLLSTTVESGYKPRSNDLSGTDRTSSSSLKNILAPPQYQPVPTAIDHHFSQQQYEQYGYDSNTKSRAK